MAKKEGRSSNSFVPEQPDLLSYYNRLPVAVLITDPGGVIQDANAPALKFLDLRVDEVLGRNFADWFQPTTGKQNQPASWLKQEIQNAEFVLKRKDGPTNSVLVNSRLETGHQKAARIFLSFTDVSVLKKKESLYAYLNHAAEELAKARDTQTAIERISHFIVPRFADWFSIDILKNGQIESLHLKHEDPNKIAWAREYRKNYPPDMNSDNGTARVIKTGKATFVSVITDEMITAAITDPAQLKALRQIGMQSAIIAPMSGKETVSGVVNFISSEEGRHFDEADLEFALNFAGLIGLSLENARLNEDAVGEINRRKQSEEQFRFLADAIPHKMWTSAPDGRATYYNRGWYEYTGFTDFETLRENVWDVIYQEDRVIAAELWPKAMKEGEGMEMEHRFRRHDGIYRWHLTRFVPHKNEAGEILLWVGTSTDIHEQKESRLAVDAINDELSTRNEKMASINEELHSSNEEMAAVNEELATTNEELQQTQNELQHTLAELAAAYEQIRLSKQAAQLGTFDMDLLKGTMIWDERCRVLFGISHRDEVNYEKDFVGGLHAEDKERVLAVIDRVMDKAASNGDYDVEYRTVGAEDSVIRWVRAKGKAYFNHQHQPIRFIGSVLEITEQKLNELRLAEYAERLETMNRIISTISEELDLNSILQKVTDASTELTGAKFGAFFYNVIDEKGETYMLYTLSGAPREAFEKFGMPRNTAVFHPTFAGLGVVRVDDITRDARYGKNDPHFGMPKGHLPVVSYLAVPVISRSGEVIGGLFFGHPQPAVFTKDHETLITAIAAQAAIGIDNARLYEQVKTLNEKKDEFIGLASHELKTPLTSIGGYLQILKRTNKDEQSQKFVDRSLRQAQKLTALVNDLLDVSKIEAGKLQLAEELFDLRELIDEAMELIQQSNDNYGIVLETTLTSCPVRGDSQRIEQVLINLLTNAIKYAPGTRRIIVYLSQDKDEVTVGVRDFGMGIPAAKRAQVFSRFYRVEDSNPNISGLGIGLYISNEIISRHSGKIWLESQVGKGSTFYFSLPLNGQAS